MPKNNQQCISPCFPAGSNTVHPITMINITAQYPFCAVKPNVGQLSYMRCSLENPFQIDFDNVLDLTVEPKELLLYLYRISSFSGAIVWVMDNIKTANVGTIDRVMNMALKVYGPDLKEIDDELVSFYMIYMLPLWKIKNDAETVKKTLVKLMNNYLHTEKDLTDLLPHDWIKLKLL
jgi:hypothetical protein